MKSEKFIDKQTGAFILIAFIFSVVVRLYWISWASGIEQFLHNGELMISTNDGYAFAEGARDMLAGFHQENDLSYYGMPLSTLTTWVIKFLGVSIESAMLYMSVFFSSLVVIPVVLIAAQYSLPKAGFAAALLAGVANSYYNRTMAGYYDTDMLIITLAVFVVWGVIRVVQKGHVLSLIIAPVAAFVYMWWYASAFSLLSVTIGLLVLYTLIFERKKPLNYALISLMLIAISNIALELKFALILAIYLLFLLKPALLNLKISLAVLAAAFVIFAVGGGLNPIIFQLKFYIFRDVSELGGLSFKFFNVNQTIQESGIVDIVLFCERISGSVPVFIISLIGIVLLSFKFRSFVLSFGMLLLGFLALKGGLRFTIYAVPVMALGFGYALVFVLDRLKLSSKFYNSAFVLINLLALYPVCLHIYSYKISPVFYQKEVKILEQLKQKADRQDYVLAWWDYGYPIRYYSDVKTLIDGGKHLGRDNYAVSFALASPLVSSANMARMEVEYTERGFREKFSENLSQMMKDANTSDVDTFIASLSDKSLALPAKSREIYYYLPDRMMSIFPTILQFSRLDLKTGQRWAEPLFFATNYFQQNSDGIMLASGVSVANDMKSIKIGSSKININTFFETKYNDKNELEVNSFFIDESSKIYLIFMRDYGRFLVLDEEMFNSAFIQLFVLERFDESLFEPVILEKEAKIFRLKR
ncbi:MULTISPECIES: STT3 domain-containing protein [unclassified Campylobacter]|uniref:STT3 domain-containing protein n=1 Tax=unclassified Campylobacter TaxID=2593542 RepID=UPI003D352B9A